MVITHYAMDDKKRTLCGIQYPLGWLDDGIYHMCFIRSRLIDCDECILLNFEDQAKEKHCEY